MGEAIRKAISKVAVGEAVGEAIVGAYKATVTPTVASHEVGREVRLLSSMTVGSSCWLHGSPPHASQVLDPLLRRPIDCLIHYL